MFILLNEDTLVGGTLIGFAQKDVQEAFIKKYNSDAVEAIYHNKIWVFVSTYMEDKENIFPLISSLLGFQFLPKELMVGDGAREGLFPENFQPIHYIDQKRDVDFPKTFLGKIEQFIRSW